MDTVIDFLRWGTYPFLVYLAFTVVFVYATGLRAAAQEHRWDSANTIRLGIVLSFFGVGSHALVWGVHLWSKEMYLTGSRELDLEALITWWSGWGARILQTLAALLHLAAVSFQSAVFHICVAITLSIIVTLLRQMPL